MTTANTYVNRLERWYYRNSFPVNYILFMVPLVLLIEALPIELVDALVVVLANSSAFVISVFDSNLIVDQNVLLFGYGDRQGISVESNCSALTYTALLWAAILAYPIGWKQKYSALILCTLILQTTNVLRIVSLYFARRDLLEHYDWIHENLWPLILSVAVALIALGCFWVFKKQKKQI